MALNIKNEEADRLARDLAAITGESLTDAVIEALRERLERVSGRSIGFGPREEVERIQKRIAALRRVDDRSDDEILGYDDSGLPR